MIRLPNDPALPGLVFVADRPAFTAALADVIREADTRLGMLADIGYRRIRHRHGERAIIQAELVLESASGTSRQMASLWMFCGNKAAKRARKGAPGQFFEPRSQALLYLFPADPHVPGIAAFNSDPWRHAAALMPKAGPVSQLHIPEPVRYRPGLGATWRWKADGLDPVYVKIHGGTDVRRDAVEFTRLRDASSGKSWTVPSVSGIAPELPAIALREVRGVTLADQLAKLPPYFATSSLERVLQSLGDFHREAPLPDAVKNREHFVDRAAACASLISILTPELTAQAFSLSDWIAVAPVNLGKGVAHCDVKLEHIVFTGGRVAFLDLDSLAISDPLYDFAMLEMRIAAARLQGSCPLEAAHEAERTVRTTVARSGEPLVLERYGWLKACAALQVAKYFSQNAGENHARLASDCLRIAESCRDLAMNGIAAMAVRNPSIQTESYPSRESEQCVSS